MEGYACDVARVSIEGENRIGVCRFDVIELDSVVAGGGQVAFVGGDAEAVNLRIGMGYCA